MNFESYNWVGYKNVFYHAFQILPMDKVESGDTTVEHYQTIHRFPEVVKNLTTLRDLPDSVLAYADYLVFDIDRHRLELATADTLKLIEHLDQHEIAYETWFSGNKGYHVLLPSAQFDYQPTNNPAILRGMALSLAKDAGVEVDSKIYDMTRLFRMPHSLHKKTNKYKTPVRAVGASLEPCEGFPDPWDVLENKALTALYEAVKGSTGEEKQKYKASVGRFWQPVEDGERNNAMFKRARILRERNFTMVDTLDTMGRWNDSLVKPLSIQDVKRTVASAFRGEVELEVNDPSMSPDCFTVDEAVTAVHKLYKDYDKNVVRTGFSFWDDYTMGLMPGELTFWLAVNGNLKTCILSNVLKRMAENTGKYSLLFSMDMSAEALQIRHMQEAENMTYRQVISKIREGYEFPNFKEQYKNVIVVDKKSPSVESIERFIDWWVDNRGDVGAIGFDYLGAFKGCDNDNKVTGDAVHGLDRLAGKVGMCPIICLVQARREYEGKGGNCEIDKTAGKDTSAIEHKGDYIMGSWWHETVSEGENPPDRAYYGRFLKNRKFDSEKFPDNAYFKMDFDKAHMRFNSMEWCKTPPTFAQKLRMGRN